MIRAIFINAEHQQVFVPIEGKLTEKNIERARLIAAFLIHR